MNTFIILGLLVSLCLSLIILFARHTTKTTNIVDLAAAIKIKDEPLIKFMKATIRVENLICWSSYVITACLASICYIHFWS